ncbi:hypothetical protein ES319_D12G069100v1 [Gossypium barbadense]|uniref:Uncharacterized protein n=2 Tax=Gossypium TaxID=3633 RepID=A0A5J5NV76_GOSBA|nr:hypothetical protein ES319_D12G069100v1 [Gossypium barbadense]TYG40174.1 hypothetical protein ES288_D12G072000v1 [Gossypium darwinii]
MFMLKYINFYSRGLSLCFEQEHMPYALFSFKDRQGNSETESWLIGCVCRLSSTTFEGLTRN